eukprot:m.23922 g.23922  ORF g.23922 m.23922 type:complete len:54 (-) comp7555_c0_seq1:969-1130(-)
MQQEQHQKMLTECNFSKAFKVTGNNDSFFCNLVALAVVNDEIMVVQKTSAPMK